METRGSQGMQGIQAQGRAAQHGTINIADIFLQGAMRLVDMQASAARVWLQTQGRSARMMGAPDWSQPLNGPTEQFTQLMNTSAEQAMNLIRHTNETINEVQQQFGQLMQQRTAQIAEEVRHGLEEVSRRAEQSLEQLRNTTEQVAAEGQRTVENTQPSGNGSRQGQGRKGQGRKGKGRRGRHA